MNVKHRIRPVLKLVLTLILLSAQFLSPAPAAAGPLADVAIVSVGYSNSATAGEVTSDIDVTIQNNHTTNEAEGVLLTVWMPEGITYADGTADQAVVEQTDEKLVLFIGYLNSAGNPGSSVDASFQLQVAPEYGLIAGGSPPWSAIIDLAATFEGTTVDAADTNPDNNDLHFEIEDIDEEADLRLFKSAEPSEVSPGEIVEYQFEVTNINGPSTARDVTVVDTHELGLEFVDYFVTQPSGHPLYCYVTDDTHFTCELGGVDPYETIAFSVRMRLPSNWIAEEGYTEGEAIVNDAWAITPSGFDDSDSASFDLAYEADLDVEKLDDPDPVVAGEDLFYDVVITNNGPSDVSPVAVADMLPDDATFVANAGMCMAIGPGQLMCNAGYLAAGDTETFQIHVKANQDAYLNGLDNVYTGPTMTNTVAALGTNGWYDPIRSNNIYTETTMLTEEADLRVTKVGKPDEVVRAGELLTYTIYVDNLGPSYSRHITVTDNILSDGVWNLESIRTDPLGLGDFEGNTITWWPGGLAAHGRAVMTVTVSANEEASINNLVFVDAETPDPDASNNEAAVMTDIMAVSDLAIEKAIDGTYNDTPWLAGETVRYRLTVSNDGPSTAENVVIEDYLPDGVSLLYVVDGFGTYSYTGGTPGDGSDPLRVNLGTMSPGDEVELFVVLDIDPNFRGRMQNSAAVSSDQFDADNDNNRSYTVTTVEASSDLSVEKVDTPDPVRAGEVVEYGLFVENEGPSTAHGLGFFDYIQSGAEYLTFQGYEIGNGQGYCFYDETYQEIQCSLGDLEPGQWREIYLRFLVDPSTPDGALIEDYVEWWADDTLDLGPSPDITETTTVETLADLEIEKTVTPVKVYAGEQVKIELDLVNDGPSDAESVWVVDSMPDGILTEVANGDGSWVSGLGYGPVTFDVGYVPAGESRHFEIWGRVHPGITPTHLLHNEAIVWSDVTPDPDGWEQDGPPGADTESIYVLNKADLRVQKFGKPDGEVRAGELLTYTIIVDNLGPSEAWDTTLEEALRSDGDFQVVGISSNRSSASVDNIASALPIGSDDGRVDFTMTLDDPLEVTGPDSYGRWIVEIIVTADETQDINNYVSVDSWENEETVLDNNTATVEHDITDVSDLIITKSSEALAWDLSSMEPGWAMAGTDLYYTLVVTNTGPSTAENVVVEDRLPTGISVFDVMPTQGSCNTGTPGEAEDKLVCGLGTLAPGATAAIQIAADVAEWLPKDSEIENDALVYSDIYDPDNGSNFAYTINRVDTAADLVVTKDEDPDPVNAGEEVAWLFTVTNQGPSRSENVVAIDELPDEVIFDSVQVVQGEANCTYGGEYGQGVVACDIGEMAVDETVAVLIRTTVKSDAPAGYIVNNMMADSDPFGFGGDTYDPNSENNVASSSTEVMQVADLSIDKTGTPDKVFAGEQIMYTISVQNNGPSDATNVVVTDSLPMGTSFEVTTGDNCSGGDTGVLTCSLGDMPAGSSQSYDVWVRVLPDTMPGDTLMNGVIVESDTPELMVEDNTDVSRTYVLGQADLKLQKFGKPDATVDAGDLLTYTLIVDNLGTGYAHDVVLEDVIQSDGSFELISVGSTDGRAALCTPEPGTYNTQLNLRCALTDTLEVKDGSADSGRWMVEIVVRADEPQDINNAAHIYSSDYDPVPENNYALVEHDIEAISDLSVEKTAQGWVLVDGRYSLMSNAVVAGKSIQYTMVISNSGPSTAENVVLEDRLPEWLMVTNVETTQGECSTGTPGSAADKLTCGLGTLAPETGATVTVEGLVEEWLPIGTILENDAFVYSDSFDDLNANNYDHNLSMVDTVADIVVEKDEDPDPVIAGENVAWLFRVTNDGPSTARSVVAVDELPDEVEFVSVQVVEGEANCNYSHEYGDHAVGCDIGELAPNETVSVLVRTTVKSDAPAGYITNYVYAGSAPFGFGTQTYDPDEANNAASSSTEVQQEAVVTIEKMDSPDPVTAGEYLYYTLRVTNQGPSDATNVTVTDDLPEGVAYKNFTGDWIEDVMGEQWTVGDLAVGESSAIEVQVLVDSDLVADTDDVTKITNEASVTASEMGYTETVIEETFVTDEADLRVTKIGKPDDVVMAGETLSYTIFVDNLGPSWARNVVVMDDILSDGHFMLVSASESYTMENGTMVFDLGDLANDGRATVEIVVTANDAMDINNLVSVDSDTPDPDIWNNQVMIMTSVQDVADLAVVKTSLTEDGWVAGETASYEIAVMNNGPSVAPNVVVKDYLPAGTSYLGGNSFCTEDEGVLTCGLGNLAADGMITFTVNLAIDPAYPMDWELGYNYLANNVEVSSDAFDSDWSNNRYSVVDEVYAEYEVAVDKYPSADTVNAGEQLDYSLSVWNIGPSRARGVMLDDLLPEEILLESPDDVDVEVLMGDAICTVSTEFGPSGELVCDIGDLDPGEMHNILLRTTVRSDVADGTLIYNEARAFEVWGEGGPLDASNMTVVTVTNSADLSIEKTVSADIAYAGEELVYHVMVTNDGPTTAYSVSVTDTLPSEAVEVEFATIPWTEAPTGTLSFDLGDIPAGESREFDIYVRVKPEAELGTIDNFAVVASGITEDPDEGNNETSVSTLIKGMADLKIQKFGKPEDVVNAGEELIYTIIVDNMGVGYAHGVVVNDMIRSDGEFTVLDVSSERPMSMSHELPFTATEAADLVFELNEDLEVKAPDGSGRWVIEMRVVAAEKQSINNCVEVDSLDLDIDETNNDACADHSVEELADLGVEKGAEGMVMLPCEMGGNNHVEIEGLEVPGSFDLDDEYVAAGGLLFYTMTVTNDGPSTARNVVLEDVLPAGVTYWDSMPEADTSQLPNKVIWRLDSLSAGESEELTVILQVASFVPNETLLRNNVNVYSDVYDENNANDSAENVMMVIAQADLTIEKSSHPETVLRDEEITYLITVTNPGLSDAMGATVIDEIPDEIDPFSPWDCTAYDGASCTASGYGDIEETVDLPAGSKVVYEVRGVVNSLNTFTNTASVETPEDVEDPCPLNSSVSVVNDPEVQYIPLTLLGHDNMGAQPDLTIERIVATGEGVEVTIKNVGDYSAHQPFWVDLYVEPDPEPTAVNELWNDLCDEGFAWMVYGNNLPLDPGETLTLVANDSYAGDGIAWPLSEGYFVWAQVDSWNPDTTFGNVRETDETTAQPYNNIGWTRVSTLLNLGDRDTPVAPLGGELPEGLPPRP